MTVDSTIQERALVREYLALELETAIVEVGRTLRAYERETRDLSALARVDLTVGLDAMIVRHLAKAGLTPFLERKLTETPGPLLDAVERQHRQLLGLEPSV